MADLLRDGARRLRDAGSETARLDAELLLGHALGVERTSLLAHPDRVVDGAVAARFDDDLRRRAAGEPVAYLRGIKEFFGLAFQVDGRALIPRPETERLVELALDAVDRGLGQGRLRPLRVIDVGTGSGAVVIALAASLRQMGRTDAVTLAAVDVSPEAVDLARENAVAHGVADRIDFGVADLLPAGVFDLVIANLPYVRHAAMAELPRATTFEPTLALDGGGDGLAVIGRLLDRLPEALGDGGRALLEIGADQGEAIVALVTARLPGWDCVVRPDLAGLPRVAIVARS